MSNREKKNLIYKIVFFLLFSLVFSSCTRAQELHYKNIQFKPIARKIITYLGSNVGMFADKIEILKDFSVSGLRVRISTDFETKSICASGLWRRIEIDGPINKDTSYVIDKVLSEIQPCIMRDGKKLVSNVFMNSNGGTLEDGYSIGRVLRKHGAEVVVTSNQVCASACAVAYLGGGYRTMTHNAKLIFHAPYTRRFDSGYESIKCADTKSAKPLLDYYQEMLGNKVAQKLFERTMDFCSTKDGWTLDSGAADFFGILRKSLNEV
jgi:ATP-dependent protease ClpP protease subunit